MRSVAELLRMDGRVAIVVGGAGHIGAVAVDALLELGAAVAIVDVAVDALQRRFGAAVAAGMVTTHSCDIADEAALRATVDAVVGGAGRLDVVVHSAAFVGTTRFPGWAVPFADQQAGAFDAALRVNLTSAFVLAQAAAPHLSRSGHGSVIFVSSIYGSVGPDQRLYEGTPMANPLGYGASKAGLEQLARSLATTLAPSVRVNTISPGGVWRNQPAPFVERYVSRTPLGRMATEEDLKGAVAYLASDLSAYVTGHSLLVDGGWTAW
jgi:NAD(P)-dependent dehydrogenase (short-subunit alcohol dehydrogenase family)